VRGDLAEFDTRKSQMVHRDWRLMKSWLLRRLRGEKPDEP